MNLKGDTIRAEFNFLIKHCTLKITMLGNLDPAFLLGKLMETLHVSRCGVDLAIAIEVHSSKWRINVT